MPCNVTAGLASRRSLINFPCAAPWSEIGAGNGSLSVWESSRWIDPELRAGPTACMCDVKPYSSCGGSS